MAKNEDEVLCIYVAFLGICSCARHCIQICSNPRPATLTVIFCLGTKKHLKVSEFRSTSVDTLELAPALCNMYNTKKESEKLGLQWMK
jgi:hypothetical protein